GTGFPVAESTRLSWMLNCCPATGVAGEAWYPAIFTCGFGAGDDGGFDGGLDDFDELMAITATAAPAPATATATPAMRSPFRLESPDRAGRAAAFAAFPASFAMRRFSASCARRSASRAR